KRDPILFAPPLPVAIRPPELEAEKVFRELPGPVADVAVGGGGRLLVLLLAQSRKLAVFDVSDAKIIKEIPVAANDVKIAANMNKLVVFEPATSALHRYDLKTFERDATATLKLKVPVVAMAMGSSSSGPLAVS